MQQSEDFLLADRDLSMIMVIDGARVVLFDGLPASASRLL